MSTIAFTGSAGGMGVATRAVLEAAGHRVIGVDLHDAEVIADVATAEGRAAMVAGVTEQSGGVLDGLVAGAGIASNGSNEELVVSTNYFGAIAALHGLRALLAKGTNPSAIAISSNSTTTQEHIPLACVEACLADDEPGARAAAAPHALQGYPSAKTALAHWVRAQSTTADWIGAGIRLNAIAPGIIDTPLLGDGGLEFVMSLGDTYPVPIRRPGTADEVAGLLAYLLSPAAAFFVGSFIVMDGGTDATLRTRDWPAAR
ncbi:MAG: NAD-dependent epimerase [Ilumatobacteraceae bacterium]|nr:NAD-dependent epimerase [Ilumatobacteraceae bacterium]